MTKEREEALIRAGYKDTTYASFIRKHILEVYPDNINDFTDKHLFEAVKIAMDRYDELYLSVPVDVRREKHLSEPIFAIYKELAHEETKIYCKSILNS